MSGKSVENNPKTEICRLCLAHTKIYFYINQNEKIYEMLQSLTSIEIEATDTTSIICYKCRLNLNLAYFIQQSMIKADEKFQQRILTSVIKQEIDCELIKREKDLESFDDSDDNSQDIEFDMTKKSSDEMKPSDTYCKICDKNYKTREKLSKHRSQIHTSIKCPACDIDITRSKFDYHMKTRHPGFKRIKEETTNNPVTYCKICDRDYVHVKKLKNHQRKIHMITKCPGCGLDIPKGRFNYHMKVKHLGLKYPRSAVKVPKVHQCDICSKTFPILWKLNHHKETHEKVDCPKCTRRIHKLELTKHLQIVHSEDNETQIDSNQIFTCHVCNKKYESEFLLKKHVSVHDRSSCPICGKSITTINLTHHIQTHSNTRQHICELCGAILKNKDNLRVHMKLTHQEAQYKCKFCDKVYKRKLLRSQHEIKEHLRQANFVCDTCGKKFYTRRHLKNHINMKHLKLRPYNCDICKNSFSSNFALKTHQRIHTNETPFKCETCGEGFRQKVSLKSHLKSKHDIEEELTVFCTDCGKGFASSVALNTHQRVHE